MLHCIIFSVLTCFWTVTCQTDQECRLEVSNKTAFENKIVDYIKEDATFMIIEYNLTITSNGNLTDWYIISDSFSIEPWRWYRAKGANMTRLLLMYNKILFGYFLFIDTYKTIPVNVVDHPSGCLENISTTDMSSVIMRAVVEDFGVRFENLRTSEKLYQNPYACTSRKDEISGSKYKWCCKHDLHDEIVCEPVQEYNIALIVIYIFAAVVVWLLFLYSPYLLQTDKKLIYESVSLEGFFPEKPSTSAASPKADSSKADSSKADSPKTVSLKSDCDSLETNSPMADSPKFKIKLNSYFEKDQPLPIGIFDFLRSQFNCRSDDSQKNEEFPCSKLLGRLSIVIIFFTCPPVVLYIRYISIPNNPAISGGFFIIIFLLTLIVLFFAICYETRMRCTNSFNELSETNFGCFYYIPKEATIEKPRCSFNIPMATIISSTCGVPLNKDSKEKTVACCGLNGFLLFLSLLATVPACALTFVLVTAVVVIMYKVTFIYTIVSGIAAFLVYLRQKVNEERKQHERCQKIITEKIENYITASNMTKVDKNVYFYKEGETFSTMSSMKGSVTVKGCIPFLVLSQKIYIKDSVLFHFLRFEQKKLLCYFFMAAGFITIIILLVIFINSMDFISPSIQVLVTVFTSIIPLLLKIAFSKGHNDCTLFFETEEFKKKMESYEEQFQKATQIETQAVSNPQQRSQQDNSGNTGEVSQSQKSNADERAKSSLASGGVIEQGGDIEHGSDIEQGGDIEHGGNDKRKKNKISKETYKLKVQYSNEEIPLLQGEKNKNVTIT
ncbi:hypothetical protein Bpfe_006608 [Biomphalaria pfeifferi]|uniref:Uncharacterized protein n=1 Tax=Biomphalaria pfeifferi TaxID=112525 RepID=A0AAD8C1E7_BIOPF|nr:hypothetical protein Bpfe_006608 [Biomphalaria pfeifferi]